MKKDVQIIEEYEGTGYCVEVYFNMDSSEKDYLDDELSNYNTLTLEEAERYIRELSEDYTIIRLDDDLDWYETDRNKVNKK